MSAMKRALDEFYVLLDVDARTTRLHPSMLDVRLERFPGTMDRLHVTSTLTMWHDVSAVSKTWPINHAATAIASKLHPDGSLIEHIIRGNVIFSGVYDPAGPTTVGLDDEALVCVYAKHAATAIEKFISDETTTPTLF